MRTKVGFFVIEETNSSGPLGSYWDIYAQGSNDNVMTVWESFETAKMICRILTKKIELNKLVIDADSFHLKSVKKKKITKNIRLKKKQKKEKVQDATRL